jgi:hypothetical protein
VQAADEEVREYRAEKKEVGLFKFSMFDQRFHAMSTAACYFEEVHF